MDSILDVDLRGFESGDARRRSAIVDGVMRSLSVSNLTVYDDAPLAVAMASPAGGTYSLSARVSLSGVRARRARTRPMERGTRGHDSRRDARGRTGSCKRSPCQRIDGADRR